MRVEDVSAVTRESALDIIHKNLTNLIEISDGDFDIFLKVLYPNHIYYITGLNLFWINIFPGCYANLIVY